MNNSSVVNWLLEASTPSIRYLTMLNLLDYPMDDVRLQSAQRAIMNDGPAPMMLEKQTPNGSWESEHSYYTPKYTSTHWSMTLLTELHVDGACDGLQRGVAYMLQATERELRERLDNHGTGFSCFYGNLLGYVLHAGKFDDQRTQSVIYYAAQDIIKGHCLCKYNENLSCGWGVVRTLWGLAAIPPDQRTTLVQSALERGLAFLLDQFNLVAANYPIPRNGKIHPIWFKLNFPVFYQADILFTLRVLASLAALHHPNAQQALDWLEAKRGDDGHWRGSSPFRQRTWRAFASVEETNRWVTLHACIVLKQAKRLSLSVS